MRARDNPFRTERLLCVRYQPQGTTWSGLLARLADLQYRAAIVGPEGSGKTTLLEDMAPRLAELGLVPRFVRLKRAGAPPGTGDVGRLLPEVSRRDIVLLDGAEQLGRLAWARLRRRSLQAGGLVMTSHRPGRLPTLIECRTSPDLLAWLVRELLAGEEPVPPEQIAHLFSRHNGNLRLCLRELYDRYAER